MKAIPNTVRLMCPNLARGRDVSFTSAALSVPRYGIHALERVELASHKLLKKITTRSLLKIIGKPCGPSYRTHE